MAIDIKEAQIAWAGLSAADHAYGQVVATCFAAMFEQQGWGREAGPIWHTINASQEIHLRQDPAHAFATAVETVMWDGDNDLWHRANGLQQLVDPRLSSRLRDYLSTPATRQFIDRLHQYIDQPIPYDEILTKHELGSYPHCYLTFITTLLAHRLPDLLGHDCLVQLKQKATELLATQDFQRIVNLYGTISDTKQFADHLVSYSYQA